MSKVAIKNKNQNNILSELINFMRKLVIFINDLNLSMNFVLNSNHSSIYNSKNAFLSSFIKGNTAIA